MQKFVKSLILDLTTHKLTRETHLLQKNRVGYGKVL